MAQRVFVRVDCDYHVERTGEPLSVECEIEDMTAPPFLNEITIDGHKRNYYVCSACDDALVGPLRAFLARCGTEPIEKRGHRRTPVLPPTRPLPDGSAALTPPPPPAAPAVAAPTEAPAPPSVPPPAVTSTSPFLSPSAADATTPEAVGQLTLRPVESPPRLVMTAYLGPRYPCPLCDHGHAHPYTTTQGVRYHVENVHHVDLDTVLGRRCHGCGAAFDEIKMLASHYGIKHVRSGDQCGPSLLASYRWARDNDDPFGTIAESVERMAKTYEQPTEESRATA